MIIGPDAPLHDGTKSIKQVDLSPYFKTINLIIASNIDSHQYKTEVGMDRVKFMILVIHGITNSLVGNIFDRI